MSNLNLTAQEINKNVPRKLKLANIQSTRERHGDYFLNGKFQFRVTLPNIHGGSGSISHTMLKICRESVFLNAEEYARLVRCPMEAPEYEKIIQERIKARSQ